MNNAEQLAEIVAGTLERCPWCARVKECVPVTKDSIRVVWIDMEGMDQSFDLGYGEVTEHPDRINNARLFIQLLAVKCGITIKDKPRGTQHPSSINPGAGGQSSLRREEGPFPGKPGDSGPFGPEHRVPG